MENVIDMFGIPILKSEYCDLMEDGTQYEAKEWLLEDMKEYTGQYAVIGFDGSLRIYSEDGELIFNGTLLDSSDFTKKIKEKIGMII